VTFPTVGMTQQYFTFFRDALLPVGSALATNVQFCLPDKTELIEETRTRLAKDAADIAHKLAAQYEVVCDKFVHGDENYV
jgi:hypothetical protein